MRERPRVRLELAGRPIEVLGWLLLAIPATLLIVTIPWYFAAVCRWFCRNLRFSDGVLSEFHGRGGEIFGWALLALLAGGVGIGPSFHIGPNIRLVNFDLVRIDLGNFPGLGSAAIGGCVLLWLIGAIGQLEVIRWCVAKTALSTPERFRFHGTYWELVGWELLNGLAAITIVGWAWTTAAAYRWAASHTRSEHRALAFRGTGFEILWRTLAMVLFCLPIVTIPWAFLWYTRWLVSQVTIGGNYAPDED